MWIVTLSLRDGTKPSYIIHQEEIMRKLIILAAVMMLASGMSFSQTATPKVTKRQVNQQARIREGVKSGELTKKEAVKLEGQQAKISHDKAKAKSDGVVTERESKAPA